MDKTLRVLNVEDSEQDMALLARHLKRAGYDLLLERVDTAESMMAALKSREWDVILCDYSMPQFNALAAWSLLKEMKLDIPFIIISGTVGEEVAVEAMRVGAHDYLMKGSLARLLPAIEREMSEAHNRNARREAEEQVHLQSAALESAANGIVITDANGKIIWVNPAFTQSSGYSQEEVMGKTPRLLKSGKQDRIFYQEMWSTILTGKVWHNTIINRRKDGSLFYEDLTITPIRNAAGNITRFVGIQHDISERMRAEAALRESEEKFRALADHSIQGIALFQEERITFVNQAFCEITGWSLEESLSQTTKQRFEVVHPDDRAQVIDRQRRFERGEPIDEVDEVRIIRRDGETRWVLASNKSFTLQGKPARLAMIVDITERKHAEEALRSKNEELSATTAQLWQASKLATMGELSASIAHELNNPLATVGLRAETLLMQIPADSDQRKPLEIISQEVERMASLVNNLLQFSRRSHRQVSTVDIGDEISNSVEFVHYHLRTRKIEVVREFADWLPTIQADRQQLRQLFLNLLTNAGDAMPKGGRLVVRVEPALLRGTEAVAIEFADSGEGIAAGNLEKIWEPFFTTKPEGKGTGLGLAICRRIVEEHSGTIDIESSSGRGTTVRIVFPATTNESEARLQ